MSNKHQSWEQNHYHPNFDELLTLAKDDPELFEIKRREYIEHFFTKIPTEKQRRLRGLQWQIDQARVLARTPMASCIHLMNMMRDSLNRLSDHQRQLVNSTTKLGTPKNSAAYTRLLASDDATKGKVIPFPTTR